ncbi:GTPase-activating protein-like isoform X1 [Anopheles albimanus]|uniref:GTPase-activating protein-like isoform X1 n=1 Tax=Anopheles albimanus TaxID=7167 RepID=UPI00163F83B2|nr:GTPase-activating protein-like isoform X1 [Anopheles albimanus]
MADDTRKVRVEEQLKIKIGEAKSLVGRSSNGGTGSKENRDVYCTIALDQEEICRTPTIERTLSPFFGEEYQFEIPRKFRYLSVYVWDRDRHLKQDKPYGKIAIRREDLYQYNHKDHWFPLRPVDEDSEVQGMAHLQITIDDGVGNVKPYGGEFEDYRYCTQPTATSTLTRLHHQQQQLLHQQNLHNQHHHLHHLHLPVHLHHGASIGSVGGGVASSTSGGTSGGPGGGGGTGTTDGGGIDSKENNTGAHVPSNLLSLASSYPPSPVPNSGHSTAALMPSAQLNGTVNSTNLKFIYPTKGIGHSTTAVLHHHHGRDAAGLRHSDGSVGSGAGSGGGTLHLTPLRKIFDSSHTAPLVYSMYNNGSGDGGNGADHLGHNLLAGSGLSTIGRGLGSGGGGTGGGSAAITTSRIIIKLTECIDLARKNGLCDPYAVVTAHYANKKTIVKRTKPRKKTINPSFEETFSFDLCIDGGSEGLGFKAEGNHMYTVVPLGGADLCEVVIAFKHASPGMADDVFLGEIRLPVRGKQQQSALQPSAWYFLQPRTSQSRPMRTCATPPGTRLSCDNSLGSLRLKLNYTADHVFPLATYDQLYNVLIQSIDHKPITASAVHILGEITQNKTEVAQPLVRLFTHTNVIAPMIKALADHEISKLTDPTTIFRGNTLVSKMMDEAMRLSGLHYLHATLRPIMEEIFAERKPCEIDPTRVKDTGAIEGNLHNLQEYVGKVFEAITRSAPKCPAILCEIFHDLRECAARYFPANKEVRYSVVSGFIFLRFFAPAILGPKLFDLTTEPVDEQTTRTLTLISKTIQSLGNLVSSRSAQQPCKEKYTEQLYKRFCTEQHVEAIKHFLEVISTVGGSTVSANHPDATAEQSCALEPVVLKEGEGMMTKRAQGRKRFGRRNFKQRYFRLTTQSLSYAKAKGKRFICDIPLTEILAVERLTERSFKMQNIFQIIRKDQRPLFVQTANCVEENEWIDLLNKICQSNKARLVNFHPRAYINGVWTCCNEGDQYAQGCTPVSSNPIQMELATALDPARDLQRIHSLILANFSSLEVLDPAINSTVCEDPAAARKTIKKLNEIAHHLEQIHRRYKLTLVRDLKYGSRQAPIGDDNYLHMSRAGFSAALVAAASSASSGAGVTNGGGGGMQLASSYLPDGGGVTVANGSTTAVTAAISVVSTTPHYDHGGTGGVTLFYPHRNHLMRGAELDPLTQC